MLTSGSKTIVEPLVKKTLMGLDKVLVMYNYSICHKKEEAIMPNPR